MPYNYRWGYDGNPKRDERIDFIRGAVMIVLMVVHLEFFSAYDLLAWERIGVISGAEGFLILSGVVVGMVHGHLITTKGLKWAIIKLFGRATLLYKVNVFIIVSVLLLNLIPFLSAQPLVTYTDDYTKEIYQLYPSMSEPIQHIIADVLFLRCGPHQFQVMGLYVVLLIVSPFVLWLFDEGKTLIVLFISWSLYIYNWIHPSMPTGAEFEYAFPLLTWQLIYFHGMAVGFHHKSVARFMQGQWRKPILITSGILFFAFLFWTQNNPDPDMPDWAKLHLVPEDLYMDIYFKYFHKDTLGILRVLNYLVALIFGYYLLTRFWQLFNKALGWLLIPIGQATLYVFIVHIYMIFILYNIPGLYQDNFWLNTLVHTLAILAVWLMVKKEFLFKWIPR